MSDRRNVPTQEQIDEAGRILTELLYDKPESLGTDDESIEDFNTASWIRKNFLNEYLPNVEEMIAGDEGAGLVPNKRLPKLIVELFQAELFEKDHGGDLRDKILDKLFEREEYKTISMIYFGSPKFTEEEITEMRQEGFTKDTAKQRKEKMEIHTSFPWHPGKLFAKRFVEQLRMPEIFHGTPNDLKEPREEEVARIEPLRKLRYFQKNMKKQILDMLDDESEKRAIVTLPTGAGKTRTVVDAIVEFLRKQDKKKSILWIAQTEELCEQAVQCFKQVWEQEGKGNVRIYRVWGDNRSMPTSDDVGIIVAGIQKISANQHELGRIIIDGNLAGVFIDEAHGSTADSYKDVLDGVEMSQVILPGMEKTNDLNVPLIGLTATPERRIDSETKNLLSMYGNKRIFPKGEYNVEKIENDIVKETKEKSEFDPKEWKDVRDMKEKLIEEGFLAFPHFDYIQTDETELDRDETKLVEKGKYNWDRLTMERKRNMEIKKCILKILKDDKDKKILYFGTNVAQSIGMSRILEKEGYKSVAITADTPKSKRREYIRIFNDEKSKDIQILCNYNVLSTGFDSPKVDTIIIARPTTSVVAYQQMIGRGLRGEVFGGTKECWIWTVGDNIKKFGGEKIKLGYQTYIEEIDIAPDNRPRPLYRSRRDH